MFELWTTLLVLLIPAALRAAGRLLAMRRLRMSLSGVRLGIGPTIVRRTSAAGVVWTVGLLPLPVVRLEPVEPQGHRALARRAALALSGPIAVYLAGAALVATTLMARGEERETNVVDAVQDPATAAMEMREGYDYDDRRLVRGLRAGDQIVAVYDRPTQYGEDIRRLLTWVGGEDGEVRVTVLRDGGSHLFLVFPTRSTLRLPVGLEASPELGAVFRVDRHRVGVLQAIRRGLAFPAASASAIRWLGEAVVLRLRLDVREHPLTYLPSLRRSAWPLRLADLLGAFALLSLLPWPGLDGGELLLVASEARRGKPPAPWFVGLFRSSAWGAVMAAAVGLAALRLPDYMIGALFVRAALPASCKALFTWSG